MTDDEMTAMSLQSIQRHAAKRRWQDRSDADRFWYLGFYFGLMLGAFVGGVFVFVVGIGSFWWRTHP